MPPDFSGIFQCIEVLQDISTASFREWSKSEYEKACGWCHISERSVRGLSPAQALHLKQELVVYPWLLDLCDDVISDLSHSMVLMFKCMLNSQFLNSLVFSLILKDFYHTHASKPSPYISEIDEMLKKRTRQSCVGFSMAQIQNSVYHATAPTEQGHHDIFSTRYYYSEECTRSRANARLLREKWFTLLSEPRSSTESFYDSIKESLKVNFKNIMVNRGLLGSCVKANRPAL